MDIASIAGVLLGIGLLAGTIATAKGACFEAFLDYPSLLMVVGGTLASVLVSHPLRSVLNCVRVCRRVFFRKQQDIARLIAHIVELARTARRHGILALEEQLADISDPFLQQALQMAVDGNRAEVIEDALRTEMDAVAARHKNGRLVVELMGRAAPAFGMIGTLVGLVLMLGNVNTPDAIAPGMAIAMMTTLYGIVIANLFCLPFAEKLSYIGRHELLAMEIIVRGVVGIQSGENPRVLEQKLSTFLPPKHRAQGLTRRELAAVIDQQLSVPAYPQRTAPRREAA
jgi:chemotaxis protein MotA